MTLLLENCTIVDGNGNPPIEDAGLLATGDVITAVGRLAEVEGHAEARGATRVDLDGAWLVPGLWDAHFHLGSVVPPHTAAFAHESDGHYMLRAVRKTQDCLRCGITSVRAVGDKFDADLRLRAAIEDGLIEGPRILASGDSKWSLRSGGVDECRRHVREHIQAGVDQIKVLATGGIAWRCDDMDHMTLTESELRAIIAEAHRWNKPVVVHAMGDESFSVAAAAGADSIEHGFILQDGRGLEAMRQAGTTFCPNLIVTEAWNPDELNHDEFSDFLLENTAEARKHHHAAFRTAVQHGIPIIAGCDNLPSGPIGIGTHQGRVALIEELRLMVANGLSAELALAAATREPARVSRVGDRLGTIEPGKLADVVAVDGNPLHDITALERVRSVWKGGRRVSLSPTLNRDEFATAGGARRTA